MKGDRNDVSSYLAKFAELQVEFGSINDAIETTKGIENDSYRWRPLVKIAESQSRVDKAAAKRTFDDAISEARKEKFDYIGSLSLIEIAKSQLTILLIQF